MRHNHPKGYSTLTFIIIISGTLLTLSLFLHVRIRAGQDNHHLIHSSETAASASLSCLEEAHIRLHRDRTYTGGKLNISDATCTITIDAVGADYDITSTSQHASAVRVFQLRVAEQGGKLEPTLLTELP